MRETLGGVDADRLERSCNRRRDSIRFGACAPGLERAEVYLSACAYEPHRHAVYGIGITSAGVQTFRYRGTRRICLPGQLHVLHPDETHDGAAGTDDGFGYRILYVAPELVRDALDGGALPFVAEPVQRPTPTTHLVASLLADIDEPISDLARVEIAATLADALCSLGGRPSHHPVTIDLRAVELARDYLAAHAREQTPASTLEQVTGADRFTLARHFRRAFGTSPDRYRTLRRLALARTAIERGLPLAQAAAHAGFADQSHMTRQFKRTYGLTPGRWTALTAAGLGIELRQGVAPFSSWHRRW
jgi:AraC-like DNA-binding protein